MRALMLTGSALGLMAAGGAVAQPSKAVRAAVVISMAEAVGGTEDDPASRPVRPVETRGHRVEGTPDNAKREHFKNRMMAVTAGGR